MPSPDFEQALAQYKSQHQTLGCMVTHMFGVPMIVISVPMLLINLRKSLTFFVLGWGLQLFGHYYFEKNKPVLLSDSKNIWVPFAALFMVGRYWQAFLSGNFAVLKSNGKAKLLPYKRHRV